MQGAVARASGQSLGAPLKRVAGPGGLCARRQGRGQFVGLAYHSCSEVGASPGPGSMKEQLLASLALACRGQVGACL